VQDFDERIGFVLMPLHVNFQNLEALVAAGMLHHAIDRLRFLLCEGR
jgi:hypothetical protein